MPIYFPAETAFKPHSPIYDQLCEHAPSNESKLDPISSRKIDWDLVKKAKEIYGLTRNPNEADHIMPDGTMLDGSGRKQHLPISDLLEDSGRRRKPVFDFEGRPPWKPDAYANTRLFPHDRIGELVPDVTDRSKRMWVAMSRTGAARIGFCTNSDGDLGVQFVERLFPAQLKTISEIVSFTGGSIVYDIFDRDGNQIPGCAGVARSVEELKAAILRAHDFPRGRI